MLLLPEAERDSIVSLLNNTILPAVQGRNLANISDFLKKLPSLPADGLSTEPAKIEASESAEGVTSDAVDKEEISNTNAQAEVA